MVSKSRFFFTEAMTKQDDGRAPLLHTNLDEHPALLVSLMEDYSVAEQGIATQLAQWGTHGPKLQLPKDSSP